MYVDIQWKDILIFSHVTFIFITSLPQYSIFKDSCRLQLIRDLLLYESSMISFWFLLLCSFHRTPTSLVYFMVGPLNRVLSNQIGSRIIPAALIRRKGKGKKKLNMASTSTHEGETIGTAIENPNTGILKAVSLDPLSCIIKNSNTWNSRSNFEDLKETRPQSRKWTNKELVWEEAPKGKEKKTQH